PKAHTQNATYCSKRGFCGSLCSSHKKANGRASTEAVCGGSAVGRIANLLQHQPVRWRGGASVAPVLGSKNVWQRIALPAPLPYLDQGAHDGTHHAMQKTVGSDLEPHVAFACLGYPAGVLDGANAVFGFRLGAAEGAEVVRPEQVPGGLIHGVQVGHRADVPAEGALQGARRGADVIVIAPPPCVVAGMKILRGRIRR